MSRYNQEIEKNKYLFDSKETVLDNRFISCLKWYIQKAIFYRCVYYVATFLSGIGPLVSVSLNNLLFDKMQCGGRFLAFLISTVTGMSVLILNMTRAQEKWTSYRSTAEFLKTQRSMCLMEKSYHPEKIEEIECYYADVIEKYMSDEHIRWEKSNIGERQNTSQFKNGSQDQEDGTSSRDKKALTGL